MTGVMQWPYCKWAGRLKRVLGHSPGKMRQKYRQCAHKGFLWPSISHPTPQNTYTTETDRLSRIKSGSCIALWQQHESWLSDYAQCCKFVISHSALQLVFVWFIRLQKSKPFNRGAAQMLTLSFLDQRQTLLFLLITSRTANCGPICQRMTPNWLSNNLQSYFTAAVSMSISQLPPLFWVSLWSRSWASGHSTQQWRGDYLEVLCGWGWPVEFQLT